VRHLLLKADEWVRFHIVSAVAWQPHRKSWKGSEITRSRIAPLTIAERALRTTRQRTIFFSDYNASNLPPPRYKGSRVQFVQVQYKYFV
jgi:hypothetical protein